MPLTMPSAHFAQSPLPMGLDPDIGAHLEDMSVVLKSSLHRQTAARHWQLINRIIAYAASAEQHISEQQQRIRELEALSSTDELTGLANRRGLIEFANRLLATARRHQEQGVLCYLDLNDFKKINDEFGHETGDRALCLLAETIQKNLRSSDFVARIGGDEFIFILTHTNTENGRLRAAIIEREITAADLSARDRKIRLSVSIGVTGYDGKTTLDDLLRRADEDMYHNKHGRKKPAGQD
tara:strand:- start:56 stop:772 length:717 start_codon:yes stop_codon:yes gene_type:complete